jgi:hypothetical protein
MVDWYDNTKLGSVIIFDNSSGIYQQHTCSLNTHQCSGEESLVIAILPSIFLAFGSLTFIAINTKELKKLNRTIFYFASVILIIFLISIFMFPEISENISKLLRLGIVTMGEGPITFTHVIPASQLRTPGTIVEYFSFASDTSGNYNETQHRYFIVQGSSTTTIPETTSTVSEGQGGETTTVRTTTTTRTTTIPQTTTILTTTTIELTTTTSETTTTISEEETKEKKTFYVLSIIGVFVMIAIAILFLNYIKISKSL